MQALVASETVVHRNRRRGQGQGKEREREREKEEKKDGCLPCNFIKRRVLLAHEKNSFVFRANESRRIPLLFIRLSRIITLIITY